MKKINVLFALFLISHAGLSQTYTPVDKDSKVHFVIKNFGIKTGGDFTGLTGSIIFNPKALTGSRFNVTVNSSTVNTDNNSRDEHLRKSEYFDVAKYPLISFVSNVIIESTVAGKCFVTGNLTIKGVTKLVQFNFIATASANGYIFEGSFDINRRDFGVGGNSISLSDNLKVFLTISATK